MKTLSWLANSKKNLMSFPKEVIQEMGFALHMAQAGERYDSVKQFKGCGPGVYEIVSNYDTNAYRSIYTINVSDAVYVVHCFQKKSKRGIKTPKEELEVIKQRIKFLNAELKQR